MKKIMLALVRASLGTPKTFIALFLGLGILLSLGIGQIQVDNRIEIWFPKKSPALQQFESDRKLLGEDRSLALGFALDHGSALQAAAQIQSILAQDSSVSQVQFPLSQGMADAQTVAQSQQALISRADSLSFRILLTPKSSWTEKDLDRLQALGQKIADSKQMQFHMLGIDWVNTAVNRSSTQESGLYTGLCYGLIVALLLLVLGWNRTIPITLVALVWTLCSTMGAFGWTQTALNIVSLIVPVLVLITSVAGLVHLSKAWREHGPKPEHLALILEASFWSMLTTALGLLSTCLSSMPVLQQFGAFAALGVFLGWVSLWALALPLCQILRTPYGNSKIQFLDRSSAKAAYGLAHFSLKNPVYISLGFGVLIVISILGLQKLRADNQASSYLPKDHPVIHALHWHEEHFGPSQSLRLELKGQLQNLPQLLELYQKVPAWSLHALLPSHSGSTWAQGALLDAPASQQKKRIELLDSLAQTQQIQIRPSGYLPLSIEMSDLVVQGQIQSLALAFGLIFPLIGWMLGGWRILIAAIFPNLIPVLFTLGVMGFAHIPLDIGTSILGALLLGLVVDNTLHLILHWRAQGMGTGSISRVYQNLGPSMLQSTLLLLIGFSVLSFADVSSLKNFGILISLGFGCGLLCEMLLTPLCMKWASRHD